MKRLLFAFLMIQYCLNTFGQTYSVGLYTCDTIATQTIQQTAGNCLSYKIDYGLVPYISGMTVNLKILNISPCSTCVTYYDNGSFLTQPLNIGDTLEFMDSFSAGESDHFQFYFNSSDTIYYQVLTMGTPTVTNEPYYCNFDVYNWIVFDGCSGKQLMTLEPTKNCNVDISNNINEISSNEILTIYPNPFNSYVEFDADMLNSQLYIFNIIGELVFEKIIIENTKLDLSFLATGQYVLKVISSDKTRFVKAFKIE